MTGVIYFNCISTLSAHIWGSSWVIFPGGQRSRVMPFKQNRKLKYDFFFVRFLEGREKICFKNLQLPSTHKSILPLDKQQGWDHWAAWMNRDLTDTVETTIWLLPRLRMKWNSIHCIVSSFPSPGTPFLWYLGCKSGWAGALVLATAQETCFRSSRDDVVMFFWMLVPDLCVIPAHDRLPGTLLVCYQKLPWVC